MPQLQALGELAHADWRPARKASDGEQGLMLLRGETGVTGRRLTEGGKAAQQVAQLGESLVIRVSEPPRRAPSPRGAKIS